MAVEVKSTWADIGSFLELSAANSKLSAMQNQLAEANELQRRQLEHQIDAEHRAAEERARYTNAKQAIFEERKRAEAVLADEALTAGQKCDFLLSSWAVIAPIDEADFEEFRDKDYVRETRELVRKGIEAFPDHGLLHLRGIISRRLDLFQRVKLVEGYRRAVTTYQKNMKPYRALGRGLALSLLIVVPAAFIVWLTMLRHYLLWLVLFLAGCVIINRIRAARKLDDAIKTGRADFEQAREEHEAYALCNPALPPAKPVPPLGPAYTGQALLKDIKNAFGIFAEVQAALDAEEAALIRACGAALTPFAGSTPSYTVEQIATSDEAIVAEVGRRAEVEDRLEEKYQDLVTLAPRTTAAE